MILPIPPDRTKRHGKTRVLLDTNIWRYVIDSKAGGALIRVARHGAFRIQVAPGVVYETFRLSDAILRADIVRLMANRCFQRLMPEAYSESIEIVHEIERLRPEWLINSPNLVLFNRLKNDWERKTGGFWVRCARFPQTEARKISLLEGELVKKARFQTERARHEMIDAGWKRNLSMDKTLAGFASPVSGWRGDMVEAWRVESFLAMTHALAEQGSYHDWIAPFIHLDRDLLGSSSWGEFWFYLVDKTRLPRQWVRWAHSFAQRFRKVTAGSPGDMQLSTYFVETDIVVTADKALLDILEEYRPYAPCELPVGFLTPAGSPGVDRLLAKLNEEI